MNSHIKEIQLNVQDSWERVVKEEDKSVTLKVPYYEMHNSNYVNPKIYRNVWEDNQKFMFERNVFSP